MINEKLVKIQNGLRVTKDKKNDFGKYMYRSAEMIYDAAKPLCLEHGVTLTMSDEVILIGERYYIKSIATLTDGKETITKCAYAREAENMKGQSEAQISGTTSSYARKYCLQGLFLLDDNKDPDELENGGKAEPEKAKTKKPEPAKTSSTISEAQVHELFDLAKIKGEDIGKLKASVAKRYNKTNAADLTPEELEPIMNWLRGL